MTVLKTQNEWKGAEIPSKSMVKGLHKLFKDFVNKINNSLPTLVELGSEVSHLIPEQYLRILQVN